MRAGVLSRRLVIASLRVTATATVCERLASERAFEVDSNVPSRRALEVLIIVQLGGNRRRIVPPQPAGLEHRNGRLRQTCRQTRASPTRLLASAKKR